jgi:alkanesulfonate monooxygenase SsuD/methylene tetrahydromethanopterin reductase-like flavin-dependent oxidoreductase (luciferase family)
MNVVAGWNTYDFEMFGYKQREHDDRYAVGAEWMQFIERIWSDDQPFDFNGSFYQAKGVVSDPKPVQYPRPAIMSAGSSPAGQAFAQRWADINFAAIKDIKEAPKVIAAAKQAARDAGEDIQIYAGAWIICRDTEQEALDYYDYVIRQHGDKVAGEASVAEMLKSSARSIDVFARQTMTERSMGGFFALQLVGTPEQVVGKMKELSDAGVDGLAISWVDYQAGIAQYQEKLLPLMIQAGLRVQ